LINVNLISERERARLVGENAGRIAFFIAVVAFVLAMGVFTLQQSKLGRMKNQLRMAQTSIDDYAQKKNEIDSIQQQLDNKRPLVDLLVTARNSERKWCMALADIEKSLPTDVTLQSIRSEMLHPQTVDDQDASKQVADSEGFIIIGFAGSQPSVGRLMTNLKNTDAFSGTQFVRVTRHQGAGGVAPIFDFEVHAFFAEGRGGAS